MLARHHAVRPLAALAVLGLLTACDSGKSDADATERDEDGDVVEGGDLGVFRLQLGDCVMLPTGIEDETGEVEAFDGVPCSEEHTGEVVLVDDDFYTDAEFPGEDEAFARAVDPCTEAIESYTGISFDESSYDVVSVVPTDATWDALDDRALVCIGFTYNDEFTEILTTTGSFAAA